MIEDRTTGPAETAASRIDFAVWLKRLNTRNRKVAMRLASGERTNRVAKMFGVCEGRISQLRRELKASWDAFVGEPATAEA